MSVKLSGVISQEKKKNSILWLETTGKIYWLMNGKYLKFVLKISTF